MKIDDALTQTEIKNKKLKKAMKGGNTEKVIKDHSLPPDAHVGYSYKVDNVNYSNLYSFER